MNGRNARRVSAFFGLSAVALGAFGAHGLKGLLADLGTGAAWQTATLYHLVHAVILWAIAARQPFNRVAWWSFVAGVTIFSGSLYVMAVSGIRWLGAITPIGGVSLIAGWALLAFWREE